MDIKLLALAGIMTATFGPTACDSNKENAVDDLQDAQEEVQDAQEELNDAAADSEIVTADAQAVDAVEADIVDAAASIETEDDALTWTLLWLSLLLLIQQP